MDGAVLSIALQVIWLSGWAVLPLLVDVVLLRAVFGQPVTVDSLRGQATRDETRTYGSKVRGGWERRWRRAWFDRWSVSKRRIEPSNELSQEEET